MKKVVVTGGSGFVGRHLIKELLRRYPDIELTSISRSEGAVSELLTDCGNERLTIVLADLRDENEVRYALKGADVVLHLAAMKRVDLSEERCQLATSINVTGTINVLNAFQGKTFISMSTDKAVEPTNCYGATKLLAEKLVNEQALKAIDGKRFMIIRSGNIMGSTGSVLDIWRKQIREFNEITVTNPDMQRFYVSVDGVVRLFISVLEHGENGKIYFIPQGDARRLKDVVSEMLEKYGNAETKVKYVGLRPGERMAEKMSTPEELNVIGGFEEKVEKVPVSTLQDN
jgi:UDP-N-acetylglucosamine 4,6-dehydratase